MEINEETEEEEKEESMGEDYLFNYHRSKLAFGLILFEMDDVIKGDGRRLHDLYKFALLIYKAYGKTKHAYAVLLCVLAVSLRIGSVQTLFLFLKKVTKRRLSTTDPFLY